ncbi:MAG: glycoside hydrolase 100 family protein [Patescibacteria group bacterium]
MQTSLVEQIFYSSKELLNSVRTEHGFIAAAESAASQKRGYTSIFGRDASMCALAGLVSEDEGLIEAGKQSLITLAEHASDIGQIPFSVNTERKLVKYRMPQSIDSTIWWLLTFWLYTQKLSDTSLKAQYYAAFQEGITWLQNRMQYGLLEEGEGAGWADELPRSGMVLYTNALWLLFLEHIKSAERKAIYHNFLYFFDYHTDTVRGYPELQRQFPNFRNNLKKTKRKSQTFYASVSRFNLNESIDVFGNTLACISGALPRTRERAILKELQDVADESPFLIRSMPEPERLHQGIFEATFQNRAWQYHNAGVWPMIGGWYVYAHAKAGNMRVAHEALERLAEVNSLEKHPFPEWIHGRTGKTMGLDRQAWNAAVYILAYKAVTEGTFLV